MDEKSKYYSTLSEEINDLGRSDPAAAAKRAKEISLQAKENGDEGYALFFEGESFSFEKKYNEAEAQEKKAAEILPNVDFIISNYAVILSQLGRQDEAIKHFDEALKINPKSDHALSGKGASLSELGRYEEAIKYFDEILKINPKSERALSSKGVSLSYLGREGEAIKCYDEALKINPKSDIALSNKGVSLSKLGSDEEAIKCYDEVLKINPKSDHALSQKGISLSKLGREEEAIKCNDEALKINPKSEIALSSKGVSLFNLGCEEEAIKYYDKALKINPKSSHALRNKGAALTKLKKYKKALESYNLSKNIKEWNETDLLWIFDIYLGLDELEDAEKTAEKLKQVLNAKKKSTLSAEYYLNLIKDKREKVVKRPEFEELDDSMTKVLEYFGPEKTQEFLDEIKKQTEKQEQILIADKESRKVITSPTEGFLSVLRRWNSFTPVMNLQDSKGGGYFLYIARTGIIIDPGFDFIKNYFDEKFGLPDFNHIFITHSHIDHTADLESIFSLLYESNEKNDKKKCIELYMNIGCIKKISGWLNLKEEYIKQVHILEAGVEIPINDQLRVLPARAKHNEITDEIYSLGYIFKTKDFNVGFTGDTGWELDGSLAEPYKNCRVLVTHLGSIYESEFGKKDRIKKNHLGLLGISGMIGKSEPALCLISEFGEELQDLRIKIAEGLTRALNVKCISADVGTEVAFTDPPSIRCSICGKFSTEINSDEEYQQILFICKQCKSEMGLGERINRYLKGERWELWDEIRR